MSDSHLFVYLSQSQFQSQFQSHPNTDIFSKSMDIGIIIDEKKSSRVKGGISNTSTYRLKGTKTSTTKNTMSRIETAMGPLSRSLGGRPVVLSDTEAFLDGK